MLEKCDELLKIRCEQRSNNKLIKINNAKLYGFIEKYVKLCNPDSVYICNDSEKDRQYIKNRALKNGEEQSLALSWHMIHFDGYNDHARDKANTKYLLPEGAGLGAALNATDKESGLEEVHEYLNNIMAGKEMYILFFCLGPTNSEFSIPCVQITD